MTVHSQTRPETAEDAAPRQDWRSRLRGSRAGNMGVLAVTFLLVVAGAYLLNRSGDDGDSRAEGSTVSAVELVGEASGPAPEVGEPAQDFTATTLDGKQVKLSDYRGRPVWLLFGASWCSSCRSEAVDVQAAYAAEQPGGAVVLGVYISEDAEAAGSYAQRVGATYPQIADPRTEIASQYRVVGIPAHYFIDSDGVVRSIQVGSLSARQIESSLADLK